MKGWYKMENTKNFETVETTNVNEEQPKQKQNIYEEIVHDINANMGALGMFTHGTDLVPLEGSTKIVAKKTFKLRNKIGRRDEITIMNADDLKNIQTIENITEATRRADLARAYHLGVLNNEKTLESLSLKSISDIGFGFFNIARTTSTQYARIGKLFLEKDENNGYYIKYPALPSSLTTGHMIEFLSFITEWVSKNEGKTEEDAIQVICDLYIDEKLREGMATKQIRKVLKEIRTSVEAEIREVPAEETNENEKEPEVKTENKAESVDNEVQETLTKENVSQLTEQQIITDTLYALDTVHANFMKLSDSLMNIGVQVDIDGIAQLLKDNLNKLLEKG